MTSVLIVEDEESLADPLAFLLRKEGFEATVVTDGPSALAEFERAGADIVLLDLMLPGLSGAPGQERRRGVKAVPFALERSGDHGDGTRQRDRQGRRARPRRRRLRHQAV